MTEIQNSESLLNTTKNERDSIDKKTKMSKKRSYCSFSSYIYKVLKQVYADMGITNSAILVMDSFVHDIMDRIINEAGRIAKYNKKITVSAREIQTATRLILPGELSRHAVSEGTKAITKFKYNK